MTDETRGWKRGSEFSDYEKRIGENMYEIVRFGPMSRQWWLYVGDKTLGIITGLRDAKRAAHKHARNSKTTRKAGRNEATHK